MAAPLRKVCLCVAMLLASSHGQTWLWWCRITNSSNASQVEATCVGAHRGVAHDQLLGHLPHQARRSVHAAQLLLIPTSLPLALPRQDG